MARPNEWQRSFVRSLLSLVEPNKDEDRSMARESDHRAALAALRRGLGKDPGEVAEMHRYVLGSLRPFVTPRQEDTCYLLAS